MPAPTAKIRKLADFRAQRVNANRHTARGMGLLDAAMTADGYVAPMTATADLEIIDGSARHEIAGTRFGEDVLVIPHDGSKPVVMIRTDIPTADDPRAQRISLTANRIPQLNLDFDPALLAELSTEIDLSALWNTEEFAKAVYNPALPLDVVAALEQEVTAAVDDYAPSHVRMVQLFLNTETFPLFAGYVAALTARYGTDNSTDTVMEALRRASRDG